MAQIRNSDHLLERIADLQTELRQSDPSALAERTGADFLLKEPGTGEFQLRFWHRPVILTFPSLEARDLHSGEPLPSGMLALLLYYFSMSDGTPAAGRWISFSELPDGRFYNQAFQGYTGKALARKFENNLEAFCDAAKKLGGHRLPEEQGLGDAAFAFQVLPNVSLSAVYWCGDEDFPASCNILFDASVSHHLSTDGCAILGSILTQRLIKVDGVAV